MRYSLAKEPLLWTALSVAAVIYVPFLWWLL